MHNTDLIPSDGNPLSNPLLASPATRTPTEEAGHGGLQRLLTMACVAGGVARDIVYVTIDALRGCYDH